MKERIAVDPALNEEAIKAAELLKKGGIILYPTDTIWGIGCDATNEQAVERIYALKQRTDSKSMLVLVDTPDRISRYVREIPSIADDLAEVSDTPLTIVYPGAVNLAPNLAAEDGSVGIRVAKHDFCRQLVFRLNRPIVSTSANVSGKQAPKRLSEIAKEIIEGVDMVVRPKFEGHPTLKPSSIIKVGLRGEVEIIRQ